MSTPHGIIIEGITGAGKTQTLKALLSQKPFAQQWKPFDIFREKETFGEFMGELMEQPDMPTDQKLKLLQRVVNTMTDRSRRVANYHYILERAHFSYYALLPDWSLYKNFDETFKALNAHVFLLWIPQEHLKGRSLYRADRREWAEGFVQLHGDEEQTMENFASVQERRHEGIQRSVIPHTLIDTSQQDWDSYAKRIISFVTAWEHEGER